eukprot:c23236_g5_i2 orf=221-895(+)
MEVLRRDLPLHPRPFCLPDHKTVGLVIVDEVNGFCTIGSGNLAPPSPNPQITVMVEETDRLARQFSARNWPMLVFLDTHDVGKPEPPYPPHCIKGSGEENLVPALQWLEQDKNAFLMRKDCINGYIGGLQADGTNLIGDWVRKNHIQVVCCCIYFLYWIVNLVLSGQRRWYEHTYSKVEIGKVIHAQCFFHFCNFNVGRIRAQGEDCLVRKVTCLMQELLLTQW